MDRTIRWETEAIRDSGGRRQSHPKPSRKRSAPELTDSRNWVTLREAEEAIGVPVNTLRKWVRRSGLPSYLEADGDLALRMIDLDAAVSRAKELGRTIVSSSVSSRDDVNEITQADAAVSEVTTPSKDQATEDQVAKDQVAKDQVAEDQVAEDQVAEEAEDGNPSAVEPEAPPGTMIVPIDAWNKMLNQLGNLHEAGQDLAVARERAAKAETEVTFLRERLTEIRRENIDLKNLTPKGGTVTDNAATDKQGTDANTGTVTDTGHDTSSDTVTDTDTDTGTRSVDSQPVDSQPVETTTYWRYLTEGWRDRKSR